MKQQSWISKAIIYLLLAAGSFFCLFPIFWMVRTSLIDMGELYQIPPGLIPKVLNWDNFRTALDAYPFGRFFMNSVIITSLAILGVLLSSSLCAYSFSRIDWKGRDKVFGVILTGLMIPFFVVMIPQYVFWNALHLTDTFVPLVAPAWFGGGVFNIFLLRQFFLGIPRELDEAAKVDGAGHLRIYAVIIVPLAKQAMIVIGLLTFLANWNDYLGPLAFITSEKNYTLMQGLTLFQGSYSAQWNLMMAATTVIVIPSLVIFLIAQRHFIEGIAMTGIKG
ncbi:carbohydrate ABC transporter permease [Paenibacillus riograndensis]|uniref:Binding-protein-dependent transport systems inner membrane component n=1 Tax=Paenibacillus riograndensis SBR5 TaxID=1073571 RepID=A0A0E4HDC5_9BACL|nr:carbohydrate ABC transporter permease [Paenibacillus riograndensis]CQR57227.1 binding-protein-dependent transport systems inner membrane component [Paenibacillus riograndensis SBR5]